MRLSPLEAPRRRGVLPLFALLPAIAAVPVHAATWLHEITGEAGLPTAMPPAAEYESFAVPDVMTAGAAFLDFDGDGRLDILLSNAVALFEPDVLLDEPAVRLYRQTGPLRFEDVTDAAGIAHHGYGVGVAVGDYDNDGDPDLYFANYGTDYLYRNRGDGTFEDVSAAAGITITGWSCSAAFFDFDLDGFLDLFVTRWVRYDQDKRCTDAAGRPEFCGPRAFPPDTDFLLHNRGDGTFEDVSEAAGIRGDAAAGLGVLSLDINGDGWQDIYVTNDSYANHMWMNQGDGTFLDDAVIMGAAVNENGQPEAGMGVVAADFDNDLDFDLFMTHLRKESNTFYRNVGMSWGFEDVTETAGLGSASMPYTGFGTTAIDLELDGDLDIVVVNGAVNRGPPADNPDVGPPWIYLCEPNQVFRNDGDAFVPVEDDVREFVSRAEMSRGLVAGDLDRDGDQDLLVANAHSPSRLYRNDAPRQGKWFAVRAVDRALHRDVLGATVSVYAQGRTFLRPVTCANSYLSSCDAEAHFGLGDVARVDSLRVTWADGEAEWFPGGDADRAVVLERGTGRKR
ncbi:CRTAC1 family protein [bacterium]|nr:CRTAC1 family protein [bacterium]